MISQVSIVLWMACSVTASAQTTSPSFDCARASGEVEDLVCRDAGLAELDRKMAEVYATALKNWPAEILPEEKAFQRGWIKGRNDCWKAADQRACVENSYRTRIVELQIHSGQLMVTSPVGFLCEGQEGKPFTVVYYHETDPPSAAITFGDDQVIVFRDSTGSGAEYSAANVEFSEHEGEASVDWYGTELRCQAR